MIKGVEFEYLKCHKDFRGYFTEILRLNNPIVKEGVGQLSHSLVYFGVTKAWHAHKVQTQWNYVINGVIYVALHDARKDSDTFGETITFLTGDNHKKLIYKFPPGILHGYRCVNGPMNILYITSGTYDLDDEIRVPYDDKNINFDWHNINPII
ncbi:MAG: dTDP-4-dehydrorhamnose 3,5-epimerase family protein [Flavobacteriaceae bacterium]|jgi:dTDP-4-dehydrorhamnose 3,5-epimerase|nr:dTDP-4-dehydrorhamnose 3,5-epimerase family protein [Flavobacteriaceae bacterium]